MEVNLYAKKLVGVFGSEKYFAAKRKMAGAICRGEAIFFLSLMNVYMNTGIKCAAAEKVDTGR